MLRSSTSNLGSNESIGNSNERIANRNSQRNSNIFSYGLEHEAPPRQRKDRNASDIFGTADIQISAPTSRTRRNQMASNIFGSSSLEQKHDFKAVSGVSGLHDSGDAEYLPSFADNNQAVRKLSPRGNPEMYHEEENFGGAYYPQADTFDGNNDGAELDYAQHLDTTHSQQIPPTFPSTRGVLDYDNARGASRNPSASSIFGNETDFRADSVRSGRRHYASARSSVFDFSSDFPVNSSASNRKPAVVESEGNNLDRIGGMSSSDLNRERFGRGKRQTGFISQITF